MEFDPREWGRLAQGAAVVWFLLRMPYLAQTDTPASLAGGIFGSIFGIIILGGLIRAALLYAADTVRSDGSEA